MTTAFETYQDVEIDLVRPLATAGFAVLADKYLLNQTDLMSSAKFGAVVGAGALASTLIANVIPNNSFNLPILGDGKGLEERIIEMSLTVGLGYGLNKYVIKNDEYNYLTAQRLGVILLCDMAGQSVSDILAGKSLTIF